METNAIRKEAGLKWMFFSLGLQIGVAYVVSLLFYGVGLLYYLNKGVFIGCIIVAAVAAICISVFIGRLRGKKACPYCAGGCGTCSKTCKKTNRDKK